MSRAAAIRGYIHRLPGNLFARRDLVKIVGSDDAVDNELAKLKRAKVIERVAWGVYSYLARQLRTPSAFEIVKVRSAAFDKTLLARKEDAYAASGKSSRLFFNDGGRTSFSSIHGRIYLRHIAPQHACAIQADETERTSASGAKSNPLQASNVIVLLGRSLARLVVWLKSVRRQ